jgi:hypothetical protein
VEALRRWEDSGAVWRVLHRGPAGVTVGLFTCDGGEEVSRVSSEAPEVLAFLAGRESSDT